MSEILSTTDSAEVAEQQLAEALGESRPAGVLVVRPGQEPRPIRHLHVIRGPEPPHVEPPAPALKASASRRRDLRQELTTAFGVVLLSLLAFAAFTIAPEPARPAVDAAAQAVTAAERVDRLSARTAVRLGPAAANVVDLLVGDNALYTLDVGEASVRTFALDGLDQQPTPETLLVRAGSLIDGAGRRLAAPVAIAYLSSPGVLAVVVMYIVPL